MICQGIQRSLGNNNSQRPKLDQRVKKRIRCQSGEEVREVFQTEECQKTLEVNEVKCNIFEKVQKFILGILVIIWARELFGLSGPTQASYACRYYVKDNKRPTKLLSIEIIQLDLRGNTCLYGGAQVGRQKDLHQGNLLEMFVMT